MAFTNIWDTSFPPDTQLANQLGLDLRNFRLDTQQRMGAISGLDAARPNFAGDAQPANWNGVLFFALDTGKVYQFNNPSWTDVTSSIATSVARRIFSNGNFITHSGNTTLTDIYTIPVPTWASNNSIRFRCGLSFFAQGVAATTIEMYNQGHATSMLQDIFSSSSFFGSPCDIEVLLTQISPTTGSFVYNRTMPNTNRVIVGTFNIPASLTSLLLTVRSGANSDSQTFGPVLAEFIP